MDGKRQLLRRMGEAVRGLSITSSKRSNGRVGHRRGSAMVMVVVFVAIIGTVVAYVMLASNRQTRNTFRSRLMNTSLAASATLVKSMSQQAYYVATTRPSQTGGSFNNLDNTILSIKPTSIPGYVSVKEGNEPLTFFAATNSQNGESSVIDDPNDDWNGFNIRRWSYDAVAFVNAAADDDPDAVDPTAERMNFQGAGFKSRITINFIPLYQYAIFYNNDLEFHPGADMQVNGPVHTNSTLWMGVGGSKTLNFNDKISSAKSIRNYRDFMGNVSGSQVKRVNVDNWNPEGSDHPGNIRVSQRGGGMAGINNDAVSSYDSNRNKFLDSLDANWMSDALARWGGNVADAAMDVRNIQPPLPFIGEGDDRKQADAAALIQRAHPSDTPDMAKAKMENMADIVIEGDPTRTVIDPVTQEVVFEEGAVTIRPTIKDADGYVTGYGAPIPNVTQSGDPIVTPGKFTDYRETHGNKIGKTVYSFDVNLGRLRERSDVSSNIATGNGVVYVSTVGDADPTSQMNAVRLHNGSQVPKSNSNTLTVATDRPMYLEGDINVGNDRATLLLAADAMTITSKRLTEDTPKNSAAARNVETNAIFMLGQVSSKYMKVDDSGKVSDSSDRLDHYEEGYGRYQWSGGVHNVMRYLENWGGKKHTYNGSLICLFESRIANSPFNPSSTGYLGIPATHHYGAPNRDYFWDASLKDKEPPRGMPVLVEVKSSRLERISKAEAVALLESTKN